MKQDVPTGPDLPPNWEPATFEYHNETAGAFGHAIYTWGGEADRERSWHAYCVITFKDARLDGHYPTAAEAIQAVEDFVKAQLGGDSNG